MPDTAASALYQRPAPGKWVLLRTGPWALRAGGLKCFSGTKCRAARASKRLLRPSPGIGFHYNRRSIEGNELGSE